VAAILETERLSLRPLEPADEDSMFELLGDPVAMRFFPQVLGRQDARHWIDRNRQRFADYGGGLFGVVVKTTGELIGDCGPTRQEVEGREEIEIGYHLQRRHWGRGYAPEAARACIDFAFSRWQPQRLISMIRPENLPSRRVAEKNGLVPDKVVLWRNFDHCIYQMRAEDWRALPGSSQG
jgi:[ribosomal protein S5]-alanine N-acetyltransferase